jgi:hypothetical protein
LTGTQTIKGDSNLVASNIKSGVSIFGVTGTASAAEDLNAELTTQEGLIQQLSTILDSKASGGGSGGEVDSTSTCTLAIRSDYSINGVFYKTVDGWNMDNSIGSSPSGRSITVLCGSIVMIFQLGYYNAVVSAGEIIQHHYSAGFIYQVPNTPNANIQISITTE